MITYNINSKYNTCSHISYNEYGNDGSAYNDVK